jgi:hypothetical protein
MEKSWKQIIEKKETFVCEDIRLYKNIIFFRSTKKVNLFSPMRTVFMNKETINTKVSIYIYIVLR